MPRRKMPADYHSLAKSRGLLWLGPEVRVTRAKTTWKCDKGHQWETTFDHIKLGCNCPICARVRTFPADYHALAAKCGFIWHGPEVPNTLTKTTWECTKGHRWQATHSVVRQSSACPVCARVRTPPADYHALAEKRGFAWLGPKVPTTLTKTNWKCAKGHQWETTYSAIQQGSGCRACSWGKKSPEDYHTLAEQRGLVWLGPKVQNVRTKTEWRCKRGHQWRATYTNTRQSTSCPRCAHNKKLPADYHTLAKERGFVWLGPKVHNTKTKTTWQCEKGHQWQAPYSRIQSGCGCPICGRNKKLPEDYHALAREHGFTWLGPQVRNTKIKTSWSCTLGHQWQAPYYRLQQGTGCPVCTRRGRPPSRQRKTTMRRKDDTQ